MHIKKYYNLGKKILFPICRSITGKGIKKSLKIIKKEFPKLKIYHINSSFFFCKFFFKRKKV